MEGNVQTFASCTMVELHVYVLWSMFCGILSVLEIRIGVVLCAVQAMHSFVLHLS